MFDIVWVVHVHVCGVCIVFWRGWNQSPNYSRIPSDAIYFAMNDSDYSDSY